MLAQDWKSLSLAEQVAQMVVVRASGYLFDHQIQYPVWEPPAETLRHWLADLGVGGVILLGASAAELALRTQQLQDWAKVPLLIAADIEEGVGQRFSGATWFPPPMAISAVARQDSNLAQHYAQQMGAITAQEALAIGINWVLAPVVDVNNNPNNPVINVRAFGETPAEVSQLITAFIQGAQQYPVLTTAKHFPGHGDTAVDSHLDLPVLPHSAERLNQIELPPFVAAISAGVDAVMSAHLLISNWDAERPATLSEPILTGQLRHQLGFEGLIVTDALVMGAIANQYGANEAPVLAVEAGADILLMPVDPAGAIQAVCDAVSAGRIPIERIHASVERIWKAKQKVFSSLDSEAAEEQGSNSTLNLPFGKDFVQQPTLREGLRPTTYPSGRTSSNNLQPSLNQLTHPSAHNTVTQLLRDSQVVHGPVPLPANTTQKLRNLIVVDNLLECDFLGRQAPAVTLPRQLGYQVQLIDCHTPSMLVEADSESFQPTLLQLFIRGNPFRGSAGLIPIAETLFKKCLKTGELQALVIYGSPYALKQFLPLLPPEIPCVFSYGQMSAAQTTALEVLLGSHSLNG